MIDEHLLHQKAVVQILCSLTIFLQVFLYASTYVQAALFGQLTYPVFLISDTIAGDPGRAIASFFFPMLSMLIFIIAGSRITRMYRIFVENYDKTVRAWRINSKLFSTLHITLITTVIAVVGVSSVPVTVQPLLHTVIAGVMVVFGTSSSILFTVLDYRLKIVRARWIKIARLIIASLGVAGAITFGALLQTEPLPASIFEIVETFLFTIYLTTFGHQLEFPIRTEHETERPIPPASNPPV